MRIENYQFPESSFLSLEKDFNLIISKIMKNQRLLKLLKYPVKEALKGPDLTQEEILNMLGNEIRIVPKLDIDKDKRNYLLITMDSFSENEGNSEFRDNMINFHIICHYDTYDLGDFKLRPYKIAGEIDAMFNKKHLSGIGQLNFIAGFNLNISEPEFGGFGLSYMAIHGKEDRK